MTDTQLIPETTPDERPRIRAGAIAWGLIVIAAAVGLLTIAIDPNRRDAVITWVMNLTPGNAIVVGVLVLGGFLLLMGLLAGIRKAQRRR